MRALNFMILDNFNSQVVKILEQLYSRDLESAQRIDYNREIVHQTLGSTSQIYDSEPDLQTI